MAVHLRELRTHESAGVGAISGIIEVLLQQPSVTIKNLIQDNKPISFDPRVLYRGVGINATSIAPIIAIQFGVNRFLESSFATPPTGVQKGAIAAAAGMLSALCSGPAELLMIQQQNSGHNLLKQAQIVASKHGWFSIYRGLVPTTVREGTFTAAYLGMTPLLQEELKKRSGRHLRDRPTLSTFLAAALSGSVAAGITHPFDTIKTRMQANLDVPNYRTVISTTKMFWAHGGIKAFYSGIIPRTQRVIGAVYIYAEAKAQLTRLYLSTFETNTGIIELSSN